MKQLFLKLQKISIIELIFFVLLFTVPLQLRLILNTEDAYIDYVFSYHKAIFIYLSDLLFLVLILSSFLFEKRAKWNLWPLLPVLFGFLALFHVERLDLGIYGAVKLLEFWLFIGFVKNHAHLLKPALFILILSGLLQSLIGIGQFHVQHGLNLKLLGEYVPPLLENGTATISTSAGKVLRAYGTMPHPNVYGGFLAIILSFFYYVSRETIGLRNWFIVSCGTFILWWGLLVSFSRSAWLAAGLVSIMFILYRLSKKSYKQAVIWCFIIGVSCGTLGLIYREWLFPRSVDIGANSQAVVYREQFNAYGLNTFKHNILSGIGINQYIPDMEQQYSLEPWQFQPPHNILIMFGAELGLFGIFLSLLAFYKLGFTWNNLDFLTLSACVCIIVLGSLDHYLLTIQQGLLMFAIILGFTLINKKDVSRLRETS